MRVIFARPHDNVHARAFCAAVKAGEIVIGDRAYLDLEHLLEVSQRGVFWVVHQAKGKIERDHQTWLIPCAHPCGRHCVIKRHSSASERPVIPFTNRPK